jgi:tetratricopeptide (TPR) repeat protein
LEYPDEVHRKSFSELRKDKEESLWFITRNLEFFVDKSKAWGDLCRLSQDPDWVIRDDVAYGLKRCFQFIPDRKQACDVLHRLALDHEWVSSSAVMTLSHCFSYITDKDEAWGDLHRLTQDTDYNVRSRAAEALGICFSFISVRKQALDDLNRLAQDQHDEVMCYAYNSLGKAHIFKASEASNMQELQLELEKAIGFFEKSMEVSYSMEEVYPASFCLPFYRSFYTLIFKNSVESKGELQKDLMMLKFLVFNSKNKEILFNVMENLYYVLEDADKLGENSREAFQKYVDEACKLLDSGDTVNPVTSKLIRKSIQIGALNIIDVKNKNQ